MRPKPILIGAPIDSGQKREGCLMGPAAFRVAGLARSLAELGVQSEDWGDVTPGPLPEVTCPNPAVHHLAETVAWTRALAARPPLPSPHPDECGETCPARLARWSPGSGPRRCTMSP